VLRAPSPQVARAWHYELLHQHRSPQQTREGQNQPTSPRATHSLREAQPLAPDAGVAERKWGENSIPGFSAVMRQPRETPAQMHERREKEREKLDMAVALRRKIQAQSDAEMRWARAHGFDFPGGEVGGERQMDVGESEATRREKEMWAQELMWIPVSQAAEIERRQQQLREMQLKRQLWERESDARMKETFEWVKEKEREKERDKERERQQERMECDFDDNSVVCVMNVCAIMI
jgi:hypothetical protein